MKRKKSLSTFWGVLIFFVTIASVVTVVLLSYSYAVDKVSEADIAVIMLCEILGLAIVATFCDWVRRSVLVNRPVDKILAATDKIAQGDFSTKLTIEHAPRHYNEFDCIMDNINRMTEELRRTEMLHSDFVSNVSHELKTPLAIIQNYATCLTAEQLDGEKRKEYADTLVQTAKRLSELVSNILQLNKLEHQQLKFTTEQVKLADLLEECALNYVDAIDGKGLELYTDCDDVVVTGPRAYLKIIFNNLIGNAVKFTDKGSVSISCKAENGKAVIRVADTGCGISADLGAHIFEKFYQGDTSHATEGNGLGLALVKKVIDVIGGEIAVSSVVNEGTTFTVRLN